jgi:hypothetical protein
MAKVVIPWTNFLAAERERRGLLDRAFVRPQLLYFHPWGQSTFVFPYAPREVSYSNLAQEFNEIKRPGQFPILDRVAPQLMQVSMEFRVADPGSNGLKPVEDRLNILRGMGVFGGAILVSNMDAFLTRPVIPTVVWNGIKWAWFRMTDLSIDIVQRDLFNYATQADVRMTLTEDRNPYVPASVLPKIVYEDEPRRQSAAGAASSPSSGGGGGAAPAGGAGLYTDGLAVAPAQPRPGVGPAGPVGR